MTWGRVNTPLSQVKIIIMIFKILFEWRDSSFIFPKVEWLPVFGNDRDEAIRTFNKYLGNVYHYPILDVSVLEY